MKSFLVICCMVLMGGGAWAADVGGVASSGGLVSQLIDGTIQPLLLSLFGAIITGAVSYCSLLLKRKWGLEIGAETQRRIAGVALDAVHVVEEQAAAYAKEKGDKWLSMTKHDEAIRFVLKRVPTLTQEEASAKVLSAVAMVKGLGATKSIGS